jgi:hypothetical protein
MSLAFLHRISRDNGFYIVLWMTPYGTGVSPDSTLYFGGAKSLLSGKGFSIKGTPITLVPPLYPLFLAATGLLNNNFVQTTRFLNAILFGINVGLVTLAVFSTTRHYFTAATSAIFFFSSTTLLEIHLFAWSEPLFITFSLACLILLSIYVVKPTSPLFIASSLSLGFALITRYVGIAFIPAALTIVFVGGAGQHFVRRLRVTLMWFLLACAPLGIFLVRNMMVSGSTVMNRSMLFHPMSVSAYIAKVIGTLFDFITPLSFPIEVRLAIFGLLAASIIAPFILLFNKNLTDINWRSLGIVVPASCLLFSFFYLLFLFISISLFDASTPVDSRLLSPVLVLLIVGAFSAIWTVSQTLKKPVLWWCFFFFLVLLIPIKIPDAIQSAAALHENGLGYTSKQTRDSESIAFIRSLDGDTRIYSNGEYVIDFLTQKESLSLPERIFSVSMKANPSYNNDIKECLHRYRRE